MLKRQRDNWTTTEFYANLEVNPTQTHNELINDTIRGFAKEKILPMHLRKALIIEGPKTARYYGLPKIHKIIYPMQKTECPGRPIISSINSPSSAFLLQWIL